MNKSDRQYKIPKETLVGVKLLPGCLVQVK